MPEVQTSQQSGEMTQRFVSMVMMQAQQAGLFLGQIPHPQTGKTEKNLEAARLFIDQLEMIREKTRNNLSAEETGILNGVLSDLQMTFVKVSAESGDSASESAGTPQVEGSKTGGGTTEPDPKDATPPKSASPSETSDEDSSSRKKFTKSYGS